MTKTTPPNQKHCSSKHAAAILGVTTRTIQSWPESGILDPWKTPGGHRRFNLEDVEGLRANLTKEVGDVESESSIRILIIEDDSDLLRLYEMAIEGWDYPVTLELATDGFQGLIKMGAWKPNIVITDLQMPNINGIEMLESISETKLFKSMNIIVVTGLSKMEVKQQGGLPEGVILFTKPIPFEDIKEIVDQQCKTILVR